MASESVRLRHRILDLDSATNLDSSLVVKMRERGTVRALGRLYPLSYKLAQPGGTHELMLKDCRCFAKSRARSPERSNEVENDPSGRTLAL